MWAQAAIRHRNQADAVSVRVHLTCEQSYRHIMALSATTASEYVFARGKWEQPASLEVASCMEDVEALPDKMVM
jgi:hypothetical protein